jgi:hypothetical protein
VHGWLSPPVHQFGQSVTQIIATCRLDAAELARRGPTDRTS